MLNVESGLVIERVRDHVQWVIQARSHGGAPTELARFAYDRGEEDSEEVFDRVVAWLSPESTFDLAVSVADVSGEGL
jgi:hypothetical protein